MKKALILTLVTCMLLPLAVACAPTQPSATPAPAETTGAPEGTQAPTDATAEPTEPREVLEYNTVFVISKERVPDSPSLLDELLLEKFAIKMNWEQMASSSVDEKLNLLFAAKDIPDMVWPVGVTSKYPKKFGTDGLLIPINNYFDKLPNYRALYTDDQWEALLLTESNADGNLYYLPQKNYRDTAAAWIYRKSAFDEMGLTFPKSTDELYTVLKTIKDKYPDSVPMPNQGGLNVLDGLYLAWGIQKDSFVDANGTLVPYGRATDEYREILQYANKLWSEGLINKEFATGTEQQWTEQYANGKAFMQYSFATRVTWAEENMKATDPDVEFAWSTENVSKDPANGFFYNAETPYTTGGPFFSVEMEGEKMDRMMEWYDWLCTAEGSLFINMGVEGKTFEYVDGEPRFMSHMYHSERNPEGDRDWKYGLYLGNIVQHPAYLREVGKEVDLLLSETMVSNPNAHAFPVIAWKFSESDEKKINALDTVIKDIADEYAMKFIMGMLDASSDADWQNYMSALDGVGLQDAIALRQANYATVGQ